MRAALVLLLAAVAVLAGVIGLELRAPEAVGTVGVPAGSAPAAVVTPAVAADSAAAAGLVAGILQRPLFSPARRPAAGSGPAAAGLPRLTGVTVSDGGRWALFAGEAGGRGLSVPEGGSVGRFVVRSVLPGQVVVEGPGGAQTLRPGFGGPVAEVAVPVAAPRGTSMQDLLANGAPPRTPTPGLPRLGAPAAGEAVPPPEPGQAAGLDDLLRAPMRDIGVPGMQSPSQQVGPR